METSRGISPSASDAKLVRRVAMRIFSVRFGERLKVARPAVGGVFMTSDGERELVAPTKFASPGYSAEIAFVPCGRVLTEKAAAPDAIVTGEEAAMPLVLNCTAPEGAPAPGATTARFAVKVTVAPGSAGFWEVERVIPDCALLMSAMVVADEEKS